MRKRKERAPSVYSSSSWCREEGVRTKIKEEDERGYLGGQTVKKSRIEVGPGDVGLSFIGIRIYKNMSKYRAYPSE